MSTNTIRSLKDIPISLFEEYGNSSTVKNSTKTDGKDRLLTSTCRVLDPHFEKITLVYHEFVSHVGKHNTWSLQLYADEVDTSMFDLYQTNRLCDPLLTITVGALHPLPGNDTSKMNWAKGRGFWIHDIMTMYVGGYHSSNFTISMIGNGDDILRYFLVSEITKSAYQKGLGVKIVGHWEREWNPRGKYLKRPSKIT